MDLLCKNVFCEHMLDRNPWTGEKIENSIEKAILLQVPEML